MGALGIDVGLKGVTDLEPNAEPIRTQFQRVNSFRLGMRMQPLEVWTFRCIIARIVLRTVSQCR